MINTAYQEMQKMKSKKKKKKEKEVGGEPRAEESSENFRKDKHSLPGNEKEEVKKREEAKLKEVGGEPRAEESFENVRKDKHSLSGNEKEEVKIGEEAKEEIGGVSLFSFFYLFHVAEAHLNAMQTY